MRQTLFSIPLEIPGCPGIPVFGFGLLLGVWVLVSLGIMVWLVRKQGFNADTWGYIPIMAIVAAVIVFLLPMLVKEEAEGLPIRGFGVLVLLAVVSAVGLAAWRARRLGQDPEMIFSLAIWMFVPGILCARMFYVLQYWPMSNKPDAGVWDSLGAIVNITEGGIVAYGSMVGAALGLLLFVWKYRVPLLPLCDLIAPSMMLGMAIGRLGCLMNGCCFGGPCDHDWAFEFPQNSPPYHNQIERGQMLGFVIPADPKAVPIVKSVDPDKPAWEAGLRPGDQFVRIGGDRGDYETPKAGNAHQVLVELFGQGTPIRFELADGRTIILPTPEIPPRSLPVHPTQVYAAINALLICLLLLAYDPFHRRDGELLVMVMALYAITRFLLEVIRTDETSFLGTGLTVSQNISLVLLVAAIALWFYILRQPPRKAFEEVAKEAAKA